ncbi:unnamed protein product [Boreogadus saida]
MSQQIFHEGGQDGRSACLPAGPAVITLGFIAVDERAVELFVLAWDVEINFSQSWGCVAVQVECGPRTGATVVRYVVAPTSAAGGRTRDHGVRRRRKSVRCIGRAAPSLGRGAAS